MFFPKYAWAVSIAQEFSTGVHFPQLRPGHLTSVARPLPLVAPWQPAFQCQTNSDYCWYHKAEFSRDARASSINRTLSFGSVLASQLPEPTISLICFSEQGPCIHPASHSSKVSFQEKKSSARLLHRHESLETVERSKPVESA